MPKTKESFLKNRIKSVGYALRGSLLLIRTEASIQVQMAIVVLMTLAGFYFELSRDEWIYQILAFVLILGVEGVNTAVEKLADFVHPDYHEKIGLIKDISAGAVMLVAIGTSVVGLLIYLPKIF